MQQFDQKAGRASGKPMIFKGLQFQKDQRREGYIHTAYAIPGIAIIPESNLGQHLGAGSVIAYCQSVDVIAKVLFQFYLRIPKQGSKARVERDIQ